MNSAIRPLASTGFANGAAALWHRLRAGEPLLARFGAALLALLALAAFAAAFDARTLNGVGVWVKPMKFMLSVAVYAWTLAWFFGYLPPGERQRLSSRVIVWTVVVAGSFEIGYITLQAARGLPSHFYEPTPFYAAMYALMGVGAMLLASTALVLAWRLARAGEPSRSHAFRTAVVLGLAMSFVLGAGFGAYLSAQGQHWVGGTLSDAGGLPGFGWSRDGGDLRVAHFFGLHAMQALPLAGWIAQRVWPRRALAAVCVFAVAYGAVTVGTFVQALRGLPFP